MFLGALATFRRKIGVFGIAVNGADKAELAQDGGRSLKEISDEWLHTARERRAFPLRGQCCEKTSIRSVGRCQIVV